MSNAQNILEEEMPILRPIPFKDDEDHRHWRFMEDWIYDKNPIGKIYIHKNEIINGASIPKLFSNVFASTGILLLGASVHDPGYKYGGLHFLEDDEIIFREMTRNKLDDLFGEISRFHYPKEMWAINKAEYLLEMFGQNAWDECRIADGTYKPSKSIDHEEQYQKDWNPEYLR